MGDVDASHGVKPTGGIQFAVQITLSNRKATD